MVSSRQRNVLLLNEEEHSRLAEAIDAFHVSRSFIILEAIQTGLLAEGEVEVSGRRRKVVYFRLPSEIKEKVRRLAEERDVSQQSLIRHFLDKYLAQRTQQAQRTSAGRTDPSREVVEVET